MTIVSERIEQFFKGVVNDGIERTIGVPVPNRGINIYEKDLEHIYLCIGTGGVSQVDGRRYPYVCAQCHHGREHEFPFVSGSAGAEGTCL